MTLDEEKEERARYAGLLLSDIESCAEAIGTQKTKSAELSGTLSASMALFEKKGGNKKAMRDAAKMTMLEPADFADYWRTLSIYAEALGCFEQMDMFDAMQEQERNAASIDAASMAKPQTGTEIKH